MQMEMKAKVEDFSKAIEYLTNSGAVQTSVIKQNDYYIDPPGQKIHRIGDNEMFRVRENETQSKCYLARAFTKSISKDLKIREKKEVEIVGSIEDVLWIFRNTGFEIAYEVKKIRQDYKLSGVRISLDDVEGLGKFVEIEKNCEEGEKDKVKEELNKILAGMGIKEHDKDSRPYMWMLIEKSI